MRGARLAKRGEEENENAVAILLVLFSEGQSIPNNSEASPGRVSRSYAHNRKTNSPRARHGLPTDLRGTSVSIELPENAPDKVWHDELL